MELRDFNLKGIEQWSSFVFVQVFSSESEEGKERIPLGYVFVIDRSFGDEAVWKLPAGHRRNGENPLQTAIRELAGETNISLPQSSFTYIHSRLVGRKGAQYWKFFFTANADWKNDLPWISQNHPENEGEEPKFFTVAEFYELVRNGQFMMDHFNFLEEHNLISPLKENTFVS